jgi:hypothetical protein
MPSLFLSLTFYNSNSWARKTIALALKWVTEPTMGFTASYASSIGPFLTQGGNLIRPLFACRGQAFGTISPD